MIRTFIFSFAVFAYYIFGFQCDICAQWTQCSGTSIGRFTCFTRKDESLYAGAYFGGKIFLSTNNGVSWTEADSGLYGNISVYTLATINNILFAGTDSGVFISSNEGVKWDQIISPSISVINAFAVLGGSLYAANSNGVYLTTDYGASWTAMNNGLTETNVRALIVSGNDLIAGTDSGDIFISMNNGTSWAEEKSRIKDSYGYPLSIKTIASNNGNYFVGTFGGGEFLSLPNDTNWLAINNGLNEKFILSFAIYSSNLFAGTGIGTFLSTDNGVSWMTSDSGLSDYTDVNAFSVNNGYIFIATDKGVWRRPLSDFGTSAVNEKSANAPAQFSLAQNYPNPFSSSTTISYSLPVSGAVTLKVYDALGEEVATLVNGEQTMGLHNATFDASELHNGVYFYRFTAGTFSRSGEMIVVR